MNNIQKLTICIGTLGVIFHGIGVAIGIEEFNFLGALTWRIDVIFYFACIDKFRWYTFIPLIFAILSVVMHERTFMYCEFITQGFIFQILCYKTFSKLNEK